MNDPFAAAAARTLARDALWRNPPPLNPDCDHDLLCLLVIEVRQTVTCRKCGGLDQDASRRVITEDGRFLPGEDGPVRLLESGLRITYEVWAESGPVIQVTYDT
jgi:hypothetical protein